MYNDLNLKTALHHKQRSENDSLIKALRQNETSHKRFPELKYREVTAILYNEKPRFPAAINTVLLVNNGNQFNIQNLSENDGDNPIWSFNSLDLRGFIFSGNLYKRSYFYGTDLTNADLSKMLVEEIYFNSSTMLDGIKFPANILDEGVLANEGSKKQVVAQLGRTYVAQGGAISHRRFSFWRGHALGQVVEEYQARAQANPDGASYKTLHQHGFMT